MLGLYLSDILDCFTLTDITLPKSITFIGSNAFGHSSSRPKKSMIYSGTKAEWGAIKKEPASSRIFVDCTIHCTDGDVDFFFNGWASRLLVSHQLQHYKLNAILLWFCVDDIAFLYYDLSRWSRSFCQICFMVKTILSDLDHFFFLLHHFFLLC